MGVNENKETNSVLSELELYQNVFEKIEPNLVISSFEVTFDICLSNKFNKNL